MGKSVLPRRKPEELSLHQEKKRIERARKKIIESQDAFDDKGAAILELLDEDEMFWRRNMKDWIERNEVLHEDAGIAGAGGLGNLLGEYSNGGEVKKKPFLEKIFGPTLKSQWDTFTEKQKQYIRENHPNSVPEGKAQGGRIGLAEGSKYIPNAPLYDYKTDKEGKPFIPWGWLDEEIWEQELDDPRNKNDIDFDGDTDLVDMFIYYKNQGLNIKDFVQKFGFKNLWKSHRELKEAGVIRDRVNLLPSSYYKSHQRMSGVDEKMGMEPEYAQGGRIGFAEGMSPKQIESKKRKLYFDLGRDGFMNMFEYLQSELSGRDLEGSYKEGGRIGMLGGGLLRTGIMEILWPLLKEGGRRGTLGDARAVVEYAVKSGRGKIKDISEIMKKYKFTRAVGLAKDVKKGLLEKIKGYKEGFQGGGGYERVGDWKGELKWLIKETREDIKKVDEFLLKKEAGAATKHAEGGRIGFKEGTKFDPKKNALENWWADQGPWAKGLYGISSLSEFVDMISPFLFEKGGRVGFQDGEGIMSKAGNVVDPRNIPYYAGKGLQGLVHSAETLSKFPLAAGELGSKLIQQPGFKKVTRQKSDDPMEELFLQQTGQDYRLEPTEVWGEALENIAPGSWSENLGLTSLIEGMEKDRSPEAITAGGILGLGTEIAVPTGGAFKAGQLLLNKASKAMGKVKDGKNLNKLIDENLTDFGQSRRDFNVMAGTSGLMIALKSIGLGGLFKAATKIKPSDDVVMTLRTFIDDSDVMTEAGPVATGKWGGAFDVASLTNAAQKTLKKIMGKDYKVSLDKEYIFGQSGELGSVVKGNTKTHIPKDDMFLNVPTDEASYIADALKKAGHKVKFEHIDDGYGSGVDYLLQHFKKERDYWKGRIKDKDHTDNYKKFSEKVKKMTEREKIEYHSSITDDYGYHLNEDVKEVLDILMPIKKAEGGRIGLGAGGPSYEDFEEFMEDMKGMNKQQSREEFLKNWEKYKKWKYGDELSGGYLRREEVAGGGRLTRTIPPRRGPVPQGLSYLLYDDTMRTGSR